jgi:ankyrin repeat protein
MKHNDFQDESPFAGFWFVFKVLLVLVLIMASPAVVIELTKSVKRHHNISNIISRNDVELFYEKVADNHESLKKIDGFDVMKAARSNSFRMACDVMRIHASNGIDLNEFDIDFIFEHKYAELQSCIDQYYVKENIVDYDLAELFYHIDKDRAEEKIRWVIDRGFDVNTQFRVDAERDSSPTVINYIVGHSYHYNRSDERCNHKGCYGARLIKTPIIKSIPIPSHLRVADVVNMARRTSGVSTGYSKHQKMKYFPLERALLKHNFKLVELYLENGAQLTPGTEARLLQDIKDESVYRSILLRGKAWSDDQKLLVRSEIGEIERMDWQDLVGRFGSEEALLAFAAEYSSAEVFSTILSQSDHNSIKKTSLLKSAFDSIRPWNLEALLLTGWFDDIALTEDEFDKYVGRNTGVLGVMFKSELEIKESKKPKSLISLLSSYARSHDKFSHEYILDSYRKHWAETQRVVVSGSVKDLKTLIRREPQALNQLDQEGNSPLMLALEYSLNDTAEYLLEAGASLQFKNNDRKDALTIAAINGNLEMVQALLSKNVPIRYETNKCSPALNAVHIMNRKFAKISKYISPFDRSLSPTTKTFLPNLLEIEHILKAEYKAAECFVQEYTRGQSASS